MDVFHNGSLLSTYGRIVPSTCGPVCAHDVWLSIPGKG